MIMIGGEVSSLSTLEKTRILYFFLKAKVYWLISYILTILHL